MKKVLLVIAIVALSLLISGCKGGGGYSGKQPSGDAKATTADTKATTADTKAATDAMQAAPAKFNEDVQPILTRSCAHPSCHGASKEAGMQLTAGDAYDNIVSVMSSEVPHLMRIKPGDPDSSYLVLKIEGKQQVGAQMPLTGGPLKNEDVQTVRSWVEAGAKKD
jgi:hypothetical protein